MNDESRKSAAQAQFRKIRQAEEGKKAMAEYEANEAAVYARIERQRAARLAKEAADAAAAAAAPPPPAKKRAKKETVR